MRSATYEACGTCAGRSQVAAETGTEQRRLPPAGPIGPHSPWNFESPYSPAPLASRVSAAC